MQNIYIVWGNWCEEIEWHGDQESWVQEKQNEELVCAIARMRHLKPSLPTLACI